MKEDQDRYYNFELDWQFVYRRAKEIIVPQLKKWNIDLRRKRAIDIGCHTGAVTCLFSDLGALSEGVDIDEKIMEKPQEMASMKGYKVSFYVGDICKELFQGKKYHFAFLINLPGNVSDVQRALTNVGSILEKGGLVYVNFPPFYSFFGGHQHFMTYSVVRYIPYVRLLPRKNFKMLLCKRDKHSNLLSTIFSLNRLTIDNFEKIIREWNLKILKKESYLISPSYHFVCNYIPIIKAFFLGNVPIVRELLISGVEYTLMKSV